MAAGGGDIVFSDYIRGRSCGLGVGNVGCSRHFAYSGSGGGLGAGKDFRANRSICGDCGSARCRLASSKRKRGQSRGVG